jgi:hypothetical protein
MILTRNITDMGNGIHTGLGVKNRRKENTRKT